MAGFINDITTRVTVNVHSENLEQARAVYESTPFISQLSELLEELESREQQLKALEQPVANAIAEQLKSNQENIIATKHFITGKMVGSVEISNEGSDYLVGNTATSVDGFPYPLAIEKGRIGGYEVRPVRAKALHWFDKKSGDEVFAKVSHPGEYKGDPFVEPSIDLTLSQVEKVVHDYIGGIK